MHKHIIFFINWKQFNKAFLDAFPRGIVVTDCDTKITISNKKAQNRLDIFTGTLIGTTLPVLTPMEQEH
jgi:nitrogen fixation/metabolism regulation signal transduction histidine kinase